MYDVSRAPPREKQREDNRISIGVREKLRELFPYLLDDVLVHADAVFLLVRDPQETAGELRLTMSMVGIVGVRQQQMNQRQVVGSHLRAHR